MTAMTTVLTNYQDYGNSNTRTLSGHTAAKAKIVIEKRKVATSATSSVEYSFKVVETTTDSAGTLLANKVTFEAIVRYPINGNAADVTAALAVFRDIVAGDEFTASVNTLKWL